MGVRAAVLAHEGAIRMQLSGVQGQSHLCRLTLQCVQLGQVALAQDHSPLSLPLSPSPSMMWAVGNKACIYRSQWGRAWHLCSRLALQLVQLGQVALAGVALPPGLRQAAGCPLRTALHLSVGFTVQEFQGCMVLRQACARLLAALCGSALHLSAADNIHADRPQGSVNFLLRLRTESCPPRPA